MLLLLELGEEARVRVPDTAARDVLPGHLGQDDGLRGRAAPHAHVRFFFLAASERALGRDRSEVNSARHANHGKKQGISR